LTRAEARDDRQLARVFKRLARCRLAILDESGYVLSSRTAAELRFEVPSRACERLAGVLLDRLACRVRIVEANGDGCRLTSADRRKREKPDENPAKTTSA